MGKEEQFKMYEHYYNCIHILIEGHKKNGVEGQRVLRKWDEARQKFHDKLAVKHG